MESQTGEKQFVEKEGQEMTQEVAKDSTGTQSSKPRAVTRMAVNKKPKLSC